MYSKFTSFIKLLEMDMFQAKIISNIKVSIRLLHADTYTNSFVSVEYLIYLKLNEIKKYFINKKRGAAQQ